MKPYLDLLQDILDNGEIKDDRTGVGTLSVFARQLRIDLRKGFPAVTTKKLAWKAVVGELLWFIEGSSSERRLAEITHGDRNGTVTIWTPNALSPYWKPKAQFDGKIFTLLFIESCKTDVTIEFAWLISSEKVYFLFIAYNII